MTFFAVFAAGSVASADSETPTVAPDAVEARLTLELGLNEDNAGDPISVSPDVRYGVSEALDVGLIHSTEAVSGFAGFQSGASLCVAGSPLCETLGVYHNLGVEGRYALEAGRPWWLAGAAALLANQLDPFRLAVKLGVSTGWAFDWLVIELSPNLQISLTERPTSLDVLGIPARVAVGPPRLHVGVQTGGFSSLDGQVLDNVHVPLAAEVESELSASLAVGIGFALPALYGGKAVAQTGFEARTLSLQIRFTTRAPWSAAGTPPARAGR